MKIWEPKPVEERADGTWRSESIATVISGGQVGADVAGLRAAKACGLSTGGFMPKGYRTLLGPMDQTLVEEYGLQEHESPAYPPRTEENVRISDGTMRLAYNFNSPGERCTLKFIKKHWIPYFDVPITHNDGGFSIRPWEWYVAGAVKWIRDDEVEILNVAGNGDTRIEPLVEQFLIEVFKRLAKAGDNAH